MCGVSDDRCLGFSFVRWLFGGSMVGFSGSAIMVVVPGDARPLLLSPCNTSPCIHADAHG